jgi:uncharacterized phage protein (TIGR01671 family)
MREILFRGKTDKGEWVFGFYHNETSIESPSSDRKVTRHHIYTQDFDKFVIPETVGQFAGLTDKNGKKIFEGDIIKAITLDTNTEQLAIIGFGNFVDENNGDEYLGFYIEFDGSKTTITQLSMKEVENRFEVIGNIHDNPELLETGE